MSTSNAFEIFLNVVNRHPEYSGEGGEWSDINHFLLLKKYADQCDSVTEFGVYDWNTTWSFICSDIKMLRSYDGKIDRGRFYREHGGYEDVKRCCKEQGINFEFVLADTRECEIKNTDLLFLDTWHTFSQVKSELRLADQVNKFIIFHDTLLYGKNGSGNERGILPAIYEFLTNNHDTWQIVEDNKDGNGLMVIQRIK